MLGPSLRRIPRGSAQHHNLTPAHWAIDTDEPLCSFPLRLQARSSSPLGHSYITLRPFTSPNHPSPPVHSCTTFLPLCERPGLLRNYFLSHSTLRSTLPLLLGGGLWGLAWFRIKAVWFNHQLQKPSPSANICLVSTVTRASPTIPSPQSDVLGQTTWADDNVTLLRTDACTRPSSGSDMLIRGQVDTP